MFVSISQVIGCEDRLRNDLYCVEWGVKLYTPTNHVGTAANALVLYALVASKQHKKNVLIVHQNALDTARIVRVIA